MEAMLCLRVSHAPACRPDCLLSHPSRANPLLRRHLAFPHGGARVAAGLWAVWPQPPASPPPAGEEASRGRAEGWHRRRGAAVGTTLVLVCALRATCLKRGGRAYSSLPNSSGDAPPASNQEQAGGGNPQLPADGVEGFALAPLVNVMSGIFEGAVAVREPPALLQLVIDRIGDEVRFLRQRFEKPSLLRLLLQHLSDQVDIQEHSCWEASYRGLKTTSSIYAEWWGLPENERKYNLGLLLTQIFINQGNYKKAQEICKHIIKDSPEMDPRPKLLMAIIKTMLAMQRMLDPGTTEADLLIIKNMRDEAMKQWENYCDAAQKHSKPPDTNDN